jgi:hypothetical protein
MKKYSWLKFLAIGLLLIPFGQSCTDLDEDLFDTVTEDNFFKTDEEFSSALGAAYSSLGGYGGNGNIYSLQEVTSDEIVVPTRGQDWDDGGHWRRLHTHTYNLEDDIINNGWSFFYGGISACNRLIFQFQGLDIDESEKQAVVDELRTLRALYYLWLIDTYGRVPIVDRFDVPPDFQPPNNTRQEVYTFIENELTQTISAGNLSEDVDQSTYGRATKWVAHMILANLYLNAEVYTGTAQWAKAAEQANMVINSGKFDLAGSYFDNFNVNNSGSIEFIMAIPYDEVFFTGFNLPMMTLHYLSQGTYNLTSQPWNGFCTLEEFYNSYEDGDLRKGKPNTENGPSGVRGNFLVGPQFSASGERLMDSGAESGDPDGPPLTFTPEINELGPNALRQAGARIGKFEFALGATPDLSNDFPIFRYAEALMIRAEALWRVNKGSTDALDLVNMIRERADVDPFTSLSEENLLAELGREFFSESKRRTQLIRFGQYNEAWWEKPADPSDHVNIFPIPRSQLDANKSLTQNPGY